MKTNEQQLNQYIDNILEHSVSADQEIYPEAASMDKKIIFALSTADFSMESRIRQSLKHQLLTKRKEITINSFVPRRSISRLSLIGILLALILIAASPMGVSLAQSIINIVQTWKLGEGSTAVSVDGDFVAVPVENGVTILEPAPEGGIEEPSIEDLTGEDPHALGINLTFEQATRLVDFKLLQPNSNFIPEGYQFQGVTVFNEERTQTDYLKFEDIGLIGLGQTVVGGINGDVQITFTSDMTIVEVQVNGQDGLWISPTDGSGMLMWEADGINYQLQLMGVGDLDLALQIAESLE